MILHGRKSLLSKGAQVRIGQLFGCVFELFDVLLMIFDHVLSVFLLSVFLIEVFPAKLLEPLDLEVFPVTHLRRQQSSLAFGNSPELSIGFPVIAYHALAKVLDCLVASLLSSQLAQLDLRSASPGGITHEL